MAATNLQVNWTGVSHNSVTLSRITNVSIDRGGRLITFKGDNQIFPVVAVNADNSPSATVSMADPATLMGIVPGTQGTFNATHKDAKGATGGDILYVLANAVMESPSTSGAHAQFGTAQARFIGISTDGTTTPLTFTRA